MKHVIITIPRIAISLPLANSLIEDALIGLESTKVALIINGYDCVLTNAFFVHYLINKLSNYPLVKVVVRLGGPDALQALDEIPNVSYSGSDFEIMMDTLKSNTVQEIDSIGSYVSVTYVVNNLEELAIKLLQKGFKLTNRSEVDDEII